MKNAIIRLSLRTLYRREFIKNNIFQLATIGTLVLSLESMTFLQTIIVNSTSGVFTTVMSDHQMIYTYSNDSL